MRVLPSVTITSTKPPGYSLLLHQRSNIMLTISPRFEWRTEIRNRLFFQKNNTTDTAFVQSLSNPIGYFTGDKISRLGSNVLWSMNVDRFWLSIKHRQWNLVLGRQRIHWGNAVVWSPNDIFQSNDLSDIDYVERPGADGFWWKCQVGKTARVELAGILGKEVNKPVLGARYFFNYRGVDGQLIAAIANQQPTIGAGFAVGTGRWMNRAEVQYRKTTTGPSWQTALETETMLLNKSIIGVALLYNSRGQTSATADTADFVLRTTPEQIMPTRWSGLCRVNYEINPLLRVHTTVVYTPGPGFFFVQAALQDDIGKNTEYGIFIQTGLRSRSAPWSVDFFRVLLRVSYSF